MTGPNAPIGAHDQRATPNAPIGAHDAQGDVDAPILAEGQSLPVAGVVLLAESTAMPGGRASIDDLVDVVAAAVDGGVRTVIVRDKHRPVDERRTIVDGVRTRLQPVDGTVLVAVDDPDADPLGADGVHVRAERYERCQTPLVTPVWQGWSAHDADEIANAAAAGANYVTISPVYPTASKPGYGPALGLDGLAALVAASPVAVVALGGITTPAQTVDCRAAGAVGVAVMGAILRSPDPAATAASLVAATHSEVST